MEPPRGADWIEDLMAECLAAEPERRRELLDDLARRNPSSSAEIRRRLRGLRDLGLLDAGAAAGPAPEQELNEAFLPERFGDFRILERIGGGGMGVVFLAEQESLGRRVALKVIRPEQLLFRESLTRFRREVEIVASLQHPGIVPIYAVGEEGGIPYFAMELVRGCTLAEALDALRGKAPESLEAADLGRVVRARAGEAEGPAPELYSGTWIQACLRIAEQVAAALDHCHRRGVLHRDVKPSNIVLSADGRAMLLDFGLAHADQADQLTRSGAQLGTIFYLPPERLHGSGQGDARADVYALGVTLYEMLALQLPYRSDSRAATEARILRAEPDSLRVRNRRVPREVETVCLCAIEKDPGRRYASAAEFAHDLREARALRPIRARPPGPVLRFRRFVQRHPAASAATAAGALLALGTPTALYVQSRAYNARLEEALDRETTAHAEASAQLRRFRRISEFLERLFWIPDPDRGGGAELTAREILDRGVLEIRGDLAEEPATRAALLHVMGSVYIRLGLYAEAEELLREALDLAESTPSGMGLLLPLVLTELGTVETILDRFEEGEAHVQRSVDLTQADDEDSRAARADALVALGHMYSRRGARAEAEAALRDALAIIDSMPPELQAVPEASRGPALAQLGIVILNAVQTRQSADPPADLALAEGHLREAVERLSAEGASAMTRAYALNALGMCLKYQGRLDEAEPVYAEAIAAFRHLFGEEDDRVAALLLNVSGLEEARGRNEAALERIEQAIAIFRATLPEDHSATVLALGNRAGILTRLGRYADAEAAYQEAIPLQEKVFGEGHVFLAHSWLNVGTCRLRQEDWGPAEAALRRSLALFEAARGAEDPMLTRPLGLLAEVLEGTGRTEEARALEERLALLRARGADPQDAR